MRSAFMGKQGRGRAAEQPLPGHRPKRQRRAGWRTTVQAMAFHFKWATKGRWGPILGWSVVVSGGVLFLRVVHMTSGGQG